MVKIKPFQGYLANKDHCDKIISAAFDSLSTEQAKKECERNPMNFLRVNKPEIDLPEGDADYSKKAVYVQGRQNLLHFIEEGYLVQDD
jgi:uncharacterized protein (DUF1015 family)